MKQSAKTAKLLPASNEEAENIEFYDVETEVDETEADRAEAELLRQLQEARGSFVTVHRELNGGNSPQEFIDRVPGDKFDLGALLSKVQKDHGKGDYRVRMYSNGRLLSNTLHPVAEPKQSEENENNKVDGLQGILRIVLEMQEKMQQQIAGLREERQPQQSKSEWLAEMVQISQLIKGNTPAPAENFLDNMEKTLSFLKTLGVKVGESKEADYSEVMSKALDVFSEMNANYVHPGQSQLPGPNPQTRPQPSEGEKMFFIIKQNLKELAKAAALGANPASYAEVICHRFPPEKIITFFTTDGAIQRAYDLQPELKNFQPWCTELVEHIKAIMGMESAVADQYSDQESASSDSGTAGDGAPSS